MEHMFVLLLLGLAGILSGQRTFPLGRRDGVQYNSTETNRTESTGPGIQIRSFNATESNRTTTRPGIQLRTSNCATLFQHWKYKGSRKNIEETEYFRLSGTWNDYVSSLKVNPGCSLTVYEHDLGSGESKTFTEDDDWVGSHWNDKMTSVSCQCGPRKPICATMFQHWKYKGGSIKLNSVPSKTQNLPSDWNDQVSGMRIEEGCPLTVYEHSNGGGSSKTFSSDTPWIGSEWNDKISSYSCSCKGCGVLQTKVVSGEVWSSQFSVDNVLTHNFLESTQNGYWLGRNRPDGKSSFTLDLGCRQTFKGIRLVNTHNGPKRDRSTKSFRFSVGDSATGPWTSFPFSNLEDSRQQQDPLPLQVFDLPNEVTARYVKFQIEEWHGFGGGLQYFDILRALAPFPG